MKVVGSIKGIKYLFHPNIGKMVQTTPQIQRPIILRIAPLIVSGLPASPLTMTLYLSKEIIVIVQMEAHPNKDPVIAYISHMNGPKTHVS